MSTVTDVTTATFDSVLANSDKPILVDFWAEWCGPCKAVSPLVEQLADEYADEINVIKVNVDDSPELARKFGIRSIPTLTVFQSGEAIATQNGASSLKQLREFVEGAARQ